jgi:hypothetical protein
MITSKQALDRFGSPLHEASLVLWDVPQDLEIGTIPKRLYCNWLLVGPLTLAFRNLIASGCVHELKTWDGCFNIRQKRGGTSASLHSWGLAIDVNAAWNGFGHPFTLSKGFVKCFTDAGFEWGGEWTPCDGMHFQLRNWPK